MTDVPSEAGQERERPIRVGPRHELDESEQIAPAATIDGAPLEFDAADVVFELKDLSC